MRKILFRLVWIPLLMASVAFAQAPVHVWEKQEVTLTAARTFANPYTEVTVWVDLTGPNFKKRVYGFWDGERTFPRARSGDGAPGTWTWRSGSDPADSGLGGKTGSFTAIPWTEAGERAKPLRRGFLRKHANHHAMEQCRRHAVLHPGRHLVGSRDELFSAGTTTTKSVPWGRRPASRITCAIEKRKASTWWASSPRVPIGRPMGSLRTS